MKINRIVVEPLGNLQICAIIRALAKAGFLIANPLSRTIITFDAEGDRFESPSSTDLAQLVNSRAGIQLWLDDSTDLYISWEGGQGEVEAFVDVLSREEVERIALAICGEAASMAIRSAQALRISFQSIN